MMGRCKLNIISYICCVFIITITVQGTPVPPSSPPVNYMGLPNTQCSLHSSFYSGNITMARMKGLACLLEAVVMDKMTDPAISSFDMFRPENQANEDYYVNRVTACNCQTPSRNTSIYNSQPIYGVDPHITIRYLYDIRFPDPASIPYIFRQYFPEDIVNQTGEATPVNTEWLLADHINALKGFVSYFLSKNAVNNEVGELREIAKALNESVLPLLNFEFSNTCPHDERIPNFNNFPNQTCELNCATWHFNWTLQGLYYALGNQVIYPPASPNSDDYPEHNNWLNKDCCDIEPLSTITLQDYRNLTCAVQEIGLESYVLFDQLGIQATTNCEGIFTGTGIKTWGDYTLTGQFPPFLSLSRTSNLYIYDNHFRAFMKHFQDLQILHSSSNIYCYSENIQTQVRKLIELYDFVLPMAERWMVDHNCPGCSSCTNSGVTPPNNTPFSGQVECPDSRQEVSCLALDIIKVAESAYFFLDMRKEATPTWSISCSEIWRIF